jgi:transposase
MSIIQIINEHAAGLDVGSEKIHASIAGGQPQIFSTMTASLFKMRDWLKENGVTTVAMEATGVYWICAYEILEKAGLNPVVVNGKHVKNLPGRKTDISDCQWLATLHAHGLLKGGFVPSEEIRRIQDYIRLRSDHISMAAAHVQHMQKALDRMNIKVHEVISSLVGASGMAIIEAILAGSRSPEQLAELADRSILKRKKQPLIESLRGHWSESGLFSLRQAYELWKTYQTKIAECDKAIEALLRDQSKGEPPVDGSCAQKPKKLRHNAPEIENLHQMLVRMCKGNDPTRIPGITDYSLLMLISETGTDLERWPTEKAFTAWLGLAPGSHQSGKRKVRVSRQRNRAGRLFCTLARTLARSVGKALGGFYRRIRARRGGLIANQALARKLAELYWRTFTKGTAFVEIGLEAYHRNIQQQQQRQLVKLAAHLGFELKPLTPVHG